MTDLANINKGEANLSLKIEEGKIVLTISYDGKQADAKLVIALEIDQYLDMLKKAIPGELDDAVIELLKGAMR